MAYGDESPLGGLERQTTTILQLLLPPVAVVAHAWATGRKSDPTVDGVTPRGLSTCTAIKLASTTATSNRIGTETAIAFKYHLS